MRKALTRIFACVLIVKMIFGKEKMKMLGARDIAEYFLFLSEPDCEDYISNLKLQKLIYYAQGFSLAIYGKSLLNDERQLFFPVNDNYNSRLYCLI